MGRGKRKFNNLLSRSFRTPSRQVKSSQKISSPENKKRYPEWFSTAQKYCFSESGKVVFGDLNPSGEKVQNDLYRLDPSWELQNGNCSELAWELWESSENLTISEIFTNGNSIHVLARMPNGNYIDSMGIWSREAILEFWQSVNPKEKIIIQDGEVGDQVTNKRRGYPEGECKQMVHYLLELSGATPNQSSNNSSQESEPATKKESRNSKNSVQLIRSNQDLSQVLSQVLADKLQEQQERKKNKIIFHF